jgi:hypothetical protein
MKFKISKDIRLEDKDREAAILTVMQNYGEVSCLGKRFKVDAFNAFNHTVVLNNEHVAEVRIDTNEVQPVLRKLSSMSIDEKKHYIELLNRALEGDSIGELVNWLDERFFDYRGLIEKGKAIEK